MYRFDFEYLPTQVIIWGDQKYINEDYFRKQYKSSGYDIKDNDPIMKWGGGILSSVDRIVKNIDNPSTGLYVIYDAKIDQDVLYKEEVWVIKDEWGNPKYLAKADTLDGGNDIAIRVYERLFDQSSGKYYAGNLINLADDDFIFYGILAPAPRSLPLRAGDILNDDYSVTRANGDISYPDGGIAHPDGSYTDMNGVTTGGHSA